MKDLEHQAVSSSVSQFRNSDQIVVTSAQSRASRGSSSVAMSCTLHAMSQRSRLGLEEQLLWPEDSFMNNSVDKLALVDQDPQFRPPLTHQYLMRPLSAAIAEQCAPESLYLDMHSMPQDCIESPADFECTQRLLPVATSVGKAGRSVRYSCISDELFCDAFGEYYPARARSNLASYTPVRC